MSNFKQTPVFLLAVLLVVLPGFDSLKAQTKEQLVTQAQWMTAWTSWMNATGSNNSQVQMVEAQAKLLSAQATMVSAAANANKTNAKALQVLEQAKSLVLDNSEKKAKTFYAKRALHDNYQNLNKARPRPTKEDLLRYSQMSAPQRLTKEQFDFITGEIRWPSVLQKDEFEEHRSQIETLFVKRLDYDQDIQGQVQALTNRMYARLCSLAREVPSSEYIKARKFIRSLAYESQFDFLPGNQVGKVAANK